MSRTLDRSHRILTACMKPDAPTVTGLGSTGYWNRSHTFCGFGQLDNFFELDARVADRSDQNGHLSRRR